MTYYNNGNAPQKPQYEAKETAVFGGIVTQVPRTFETSNGYGVNVNIVTNYKAKSGEVKPLYSQLTLFGSQGDFALDFLEVGDGVTGVGEKSWNVWTDQEGKQRKDLRITVKSLNLPINKVADLVLRIVDSRVGNVQPETEVTQEQQVPAPAPQAQPQAPAPTPSPQAPVEEEPVLDITSDDLPF